MAHATPSATPIVEGQWENLLYLEDLRFLPKGKNPRYTFYCHPKNQKFDMTDEDLLRLIQEADLLETLELLQVSRSNKLTPVDTDVFKTSSGRLKKVTTSRPNKTLLRRLEKDIGFTS